MASTRISLPTRASARAEQIEQLRRIVRRARPPAAPRPGRAPGRASLRAGRARAAARGRAPSSWPAPSGPARRAVIASRLGRAALGREGPGQRLGERAQGVGAAAKRPGRDPARRLLAQPRQHAGAHQRRLAAARGARDQQQLGRAGRLQAQAPQRLDDLPALLGPAEEDRRILDVERGETRVDRPIGLPVEGVARVEPVLAQAAGELRQARHRDRRSGRPPGSPGSAGPSGHGLTRTTNTALPFSRAMASSLPHHFDSSHAGVSTINSAWQRRSS